MHRPRSPWPRFPGLRLHGLALAAAGLASGCAAPAPAPAEEPCTLCLLQDANNFRYTSDLAIDVAPAAAGQDVTIDWSGLTRDLHGHAVDPVADIDAARLVGFRNLTPAQVADGLADDALEQADVTLFVSCSPTDAACRLTDFGLAGNPFDVTQYFDEGVGTWLVALVADDRPGASAFVFLDPRAAETTTTVAIGDTTSRLDVDVDLGSLEPLVLPAGDAEVTLDWSELTRDGLGNDLSLGSVDQLFLGRYDLPLDTLETRVFDFESLAAEHWDLAVGDTRAVRLDALQGASRFRGVDADGTWVLALSCSTCTNPTPRFVSVLRAADPTGG